MTAALLAASVVRSIDQRILLMLLGFGLEGSSTVVGALASSLLNFVVFAFSIILLAVQLASIQFTPRVIARVAGRRLTKLTLGTFVFSFTRAVAALRRIEDSVPQVPVPVRSANSGAT